MILWDICCGRGGWSRPFAAAGWTCHGFDIVDHGYSDSGGTLHLIDLAHAAFVDDLTRLAPLPNFILASPPCTEYSRHDQPWTRARNPPPPNKRLWFFCEAVATKLGTPMVLENVRGAQPFHRRADLHWGPYYLWLYNATFRPQLPPFSESLRPRQKQSRSSSARALRAEIPPALASSIEHFARALSSSTNRKGII